MAQLQITLRSVLARAAVTIARRCEPAELADDRGGAPSRRILLATLLATLAASR